MTTTLPSRRRTAATVPFRDTDRPSGQHQRPLLADDAAALRAEIAGPARLAGVLVVGVLGGFLAWGSLAPLATGAVASGVISPEGSTRTVEHLEGGIIAELRVRDGDVVEAGEALVVLENVQPKAVRDTLVAQFVTFTITRDRLLAEQTGLPGFIIPEEVHRFGDDATVASIAAAQRDLFNARAANHVSRKHVLGQRIAQLREQIVGFRAQVDGAQRQLELLAQELAAKESLRERKLIAEPEVLRLKRLAAEIEGRRGEYVAEIARAEQQIGETELDLIGLDAERADKIATELVDVRAKLADVTERLAASEDILERTVVVAPVGGAVLNLRHTTIGGVVMAGEPILDIVPAEDTLVIDARVKPADIDVVHPGLTATVHLSAFSLRAMPRIEGVVRTVSAGRMVDERTGEAYYRATVAVDRAHIRALAPDVELVAGMPADVLIVTGERSMMRTLAEPFLDMFRRALREV